MSSGKESQKKGSDPHSKGSVWVLDDDPMILLSISQQLKKAGYDSKGFSDPDQFIKTFANESFDGLLVVLDYNLGDQTCFDVLDELKKRKRRIDFLAMTGYGDEKIAVSLMKRGAIDYVVKEKGFVAHMPLAVGAAFDKMLINRKLEKATLSLKRSLAKQKKLNKIVEEQNKALAEEKAKVEKLLQNVFPQRVARELLTSGTAKARYFPCVTVLYADVENFSGKSDSYSPIELVENLDEYFSIFDSIIEPLGLEKIKTIGDCYMCAGGIPEADLLNPPRVVLAGLQMQHAVLNAARIAQEESKPYLTFRIGIHTGEVVAGVIGRKKFAYDIWGSAANKAHWMVQASEENMVNVSADVFQLVSEFFECSQRGMVESKHHQFEEMFFVHRLKPQFASDSTGILPNEAFLEATGLRK